MFPVSVNFVDRMEIDMSISKQNDQAGCQKEVNEIAEKYAKVVKDTCIIPHFQQVITEATAEMTQQRDRLSEILTVAKLKIEADCYNGVEYTCKHCGSINCTHLDKCIIENIESLLSETGGE